MEDKGETSKRQGPAEKKQTTEQTKPREKQIETKVVKMTTETGKQLTQESLVFSRKATLLKRKLNDIGQNIKSITSQGRLTLTDASHFSSFRGMYKKLDSHYEKYQGVWDELMELYVFSDHETEFPTEGETLSKQNIQRYFYECCSIYEDYQASIDTQPTASRLNATVFDSSKVSQARSHLPRLNIPKFDGNVENWPIFRDTFRSIIHDDPSISNIEKFHHLITSLSGPALPLVKGIPLLGDNYPQAWAALKNIYDDPRRIANNYLQKVLEFKPLQGKATADNLRIYISGIIESVNSLQNLGIPDLVEFILFTLAVRGLDKKTRELFETENVNKEYPTFADLSDFVRRRCRVLDISSSTKEINLDNKQTTKFMDSERSNYRKSLPKPNSSQSFVTTRSGFETNSSLNESAHSSPSAQISSPSSDKQSHYRNSRNFKQTTRTTLSCCICKGIHTLSICPIFICASATEKLKLIENINVCKNCLYFGHKINECRSEKTCRICQQRHHTVLHTEHPSKLNGKGKRTPSSNNESTTKSTVLTSVSSEDPQVLLGTARALIRDCQGNYHQIRLLVDTASQHSFITVSCVNKLGLISSGTQCSVSGLNQAAVLGVEGCVTCSLRPISSGNNRKDLVTQALMVPTISSNLPLATLTYDLRTKYSQYQIADPDFWKPSPVDFLLGADLYCDVINGAPIVLESNEPNLLPSIFGHILMGRISSHNQINHNNLSSFHINTSTENQDETTDSLKLVLKKFWELEQPITVNTPLSKEEQYCEDHFVSTHQRTEDGRYIVMLPFKHEKFDLGESRSKAKLRLMHLERKLNKNPSIKQEYINFMEEYVKLGHMKKADSAGAYYIPHHSIIKPTEQGIKLRVVFDASATATYGSLNDILLTGPKLQQDISTIILNFRTFKVVFTTDIRKMFRQILIHPLCRKFFRILWRVDPLSEAEEYELLTLIYGINCAPFLAIRTIHQLIKDEGSNYPLASKALFDNTYVDDIVTGADTIEGALTMKQELIDLLSKGGFELSKWSSNVTELLSIEDSNNLVSLSPDENIKILGFQWDPKEDSFSYSIQPIQTIVSKRSILSSIARVYDPLGYLAPVIFYAKHILQSLWISGCDWDEPVPKFIAEWWAEFSSQFHYLKNVKIPRFITSESNYRAEIIGFSDASSKGYCGVLYIRLITDLEIKSFLIKSKTKLAPVKTISVPRLELCGALILSRLLKSISKIIKKLNVSEVLLFTDSTIVINWLKITPSLLNVFVANRVSEILELTESISWQHVRSENNPADLGSRGLLPRVLVDNSLWWHGPEWLCYPRAKWPQSCCDNNVENVPELKTHKQSSTSVLLSTSSSTSMETKKSSVTSLPEFVLWTEKFSNYSKLIRILAYVLRFISKTRNNYRYLSIPAKEFFNANLKCIKLIQSYYFSDFSNPSSKQYKQLIALVPFYDKHGILRVGGRLNHSNLPENAKNPIILPRAAHFTSLLIDHYHLIHLHLGASSLQSRCKWRKRSRNVEIGDIVLLLDENVPPLQWPTGIINKVFPGKDGVVRIVEVRTSSGVYKRPVVKLLSLNHIIKPNEEKTKYNDSDQAPSGEITAKQMY